MSYPRGSDVGVSGGPGGGSIGSASLVATLATYVTSGSLITALAAYLTSGSAATAYEPAGDYPTSNSVSIMIVAGVGDRPTSNSVSVMIVTGIGDRPTSNSISVQITTRLAPYLTSASAALSTYITSGSLATALAPYLTSASAALSTYITSGSLATALTPYLTSASAALSTYITSGSLATALTPYLTSASAALSTYLTSASASALYLTSASAAAVYITSNSVSVMIAAAGGLSSNSASAMIVTGIGNASIGALANVEMSGALSVGQVLEWDGTKWTNSTDDTSGGGSNTFTGTTLIVSDTISFSATVHITTGINALGNSRVSGTLSVGHFQINGRPAGAVMLASASGATQAGVGAMNFSGSWSDFGVFTINCGWRQLGNSGTLSVNIYTDGGVTPMLSIAALATASATTNIAQIRVFGGGGAWYLSVQYLNNTNAAKVHATSTLNTGIVNCIRVAIANTTATASNIAAFLTGFRKA